MAFRGDYLAGIRSPLTDPGANILKREGEHSVAIEWYKKIVNSIERESRIFWDMGGDDPYVEALNRWAARFYMTIPYHHIDELKAFFTMIEQFFRPELFLDRRDTAAEITAKYRHISGFQWQTSANVPQVKR